MPCYAYLRGNRTGTEEESWTEKARNVYNGEGMRIRQYENGNSWARQYFYIGGALAISTDGSNENFVKSENILTPDGTILAALREAKAGEEIEGNAYWIYHYDARGSATNLVGAKNGNLYRAEENIYDAFGNEEEIKQSTSSVVNDIKFTGATLDNSGTYYLGSRHYDPNKADSCNRIRSRAKCTARGRRTCTPTHPTTR